MARHDGAVVAENIPGHLGKFESVFAVDQWYAYHRMASAVEDAGFEIRDQITWLHRTGFSKSRDISKDIDALGGEEGLKIRQEIARLIEESGLPDTHIAKLVGRSNNLVKAWRLGTRNITRVDAEKLQNIFDCQIPTEVKRRVIREGQSGMGRASGAGNTSRFHHSPNYSITAPTSAAAKDWEGWGTALRQAHQPILLARKPFSGSAAICVLEHGTAALNLEDCKRDDRWPTNAQTFSKATKAERSGSNHPTIKPLDLMRWLIRLTCPPGGSVLDPFAGIGTTGEAALLEGMSVVLIEQEEEYQAKILRRMESLSSLQFLQ